MSIWYKTKEEQIEIHSRSQELYRELKNWRRVRERMNLNKGYLDNLKVRMKKWENTDDKERRTDNSEWPRR